MSDVNKDPNGEPEPRPVTEHGAARIDQPPVNSDPDTLTLHEFNTDYRHFSRFAARPLTGWPEQELGSSSVSKEDLSALS